MESNSVCSRCGASTVIVETDLGERREFDLAAVPGGVWEVVESLFGARCRVRGDAAGDSDGFRSHSESCVGFNALPF